MADFSSGIVDRVGWGTGGVSARANPLADFPFPRRAPYAFSGGTWRCIALPGGGLGPLPLRFGGPLLQIAGIDLAVTPVFVTGFAATGPDIQAGGEYLDESGTLNLAGAYLGVAFEYTDPGSGARLSPRKTVSFDTADNPTYHTVNVGGGLITTFPIYPPTWIFPAAMNNADRSNPYFTPFVFRRDAIPSYGEANDFGYSPPQGAGTFTSLAGLNPYAGRALSHQSRIVDAAYFGALELGGGALLRRQLVWTSTFTDTYEGKGTYLSEPASDVGVIASLSSSDLLVIGYGEGAWLIQGDINNPVVRRLPSVPGTGGAECQGASTPAGFVYGVNRGGVYAWNGGPTAELLSPQLEDDFWRTAGTARISRYRGSFAAWGQYVLCPNNWLYDTTTKSWWRIDDPTTAPLYQWAVNPGLGHAIGTVAQIVPVALGGGTQGWWFSGFHRTKKAASYRWTSHVLAPTMEQQVKVDDIVVVVQGKGTMTVTLISPETPGGVAKVFTFDSVASPAVLRGNSGFSGSSVKVQIDSVSTDGAYPAPLLYELRLGWDEAQGLAST